MALFRRTGKIPKMATDGQGGVDKEEVSQSRRAFFKWGLLSAGALGLVNRLKGSETGSANTERPLNSGAPAAGSPITANPRGQKNIEELFEEVKRTTTREELYTFLYDLPKGGDLHHHHGGSTLKEDWYRLAISPKLNGGQRYFTRYRIENCPGDERIAWWKRGSGNLMYWITITERTWSKLPACDKKEFKAMDELSDSERTRWMSSIVLDKPWEGRNEFFEYHWDRLGELKNNPDVMSELLVENMKLFGTEGLCYMEPQVSASGFRDRDGRELSGGEAYRIYKERLNRADARESGVTSRFGMTVLRFKKSAPEDVRSRFDFIYRHNDLWRGINMAGREDNEKGHPRRFTEAFDSALRKYPGVGISIHAGEENEPSTHIFDTLRLGATRIGHGVNLIEDAETMQLMRCGKFLVEINLVSNHLLGYVDDLAMHPFPIYMRHGIPCCLNTDDRGMWDSNMTDEYFVAVSNFNLSWEELINLGRNSLKFSFAEPDLKNDLLDVYEKRVNAFAAKYSKGVWRTHLKTVKPVTHGYGRRHLNLNLQT